MIVYGVALMRTDFPTTDGIAAEIASPELFAEHDDVRRARLVFALREESSDERLDSQQVEPVRAHANALHSLGVGVVANEIRRRAFDHGEADELRRARSIVDEVHRRARVAVSLLRVHDAHEAIGLRKRQRLEQHAVHDAEDRGVGADAERERDDRGERERRCGAKLSHRVADVVPEVVHDVAPPLRGFDVAIDGADVAARVVEVSEFADGLSASRVGRVPERDEGVDAHVEMKAELLVDVVANLPRGAPRQSKEALSARGHAGSSTLNTASAYRRHADSSALNWRRPADVSA